MHYNDEFYQDLLQGMAVYYNSPLLHNLLHTLRKHDAVNLGYAFNRNQMHSKKWLIDQLALVHNTGVFYILGGWYGTLSALLHNDPRFEIGQLVSIDIDPSCAPIAQALNRDAHRNQAFIAITLDMLDLDYAHPPRDAQPPNVIINTSCEHIADFSSWYAALPQGVLLVLQSNDYFSVDEHVNCVADLSSFSAQTPMRSVHFEGSLKLKHYTRFMRIGFK